MYCFDIKLVMNMPFQKRAQKTRNQRIVVQKHKENGAYLQMDADFLGEGAVARWMTEWVFWWVGGDGGQIH